MFNVGDRVVGKLDFDGREFRGKRGTVREVDRNAILVEFDDNINGHDGNLNCEDGHGWWCNKDDIALDTVPALKFKEGDVVKIRDTEGRSYYKTIIDKVGTIVEVNYERLIDDERITYSVQIDHEVNEYQARGWWVFHEEKSLELYNTQNDDQMDAYKYSIVHTRFSVKEIDDVIKGDNMNNILEIYESRKANKLFEETKVQIEKVKMADPTYKAWKSAVDTINKIYAKDIDVYGEVHLREPKLSENSDAKVKELESNYSNKRRAIDKEIEEIKAQLSICETYEQKQNVLKLYNVINADGKING